MTKQYSAWPTKASTPPSPTCQVPDFGTAAYKNWVLQGSVIILTMADNQFAILPLGWVEA